jgi:hypothetical protein
LSILKQERDVQFVQFWKKYTNRKMTIIYRFLIHAGGPGSVVGITTGYGPDGPGIESR